MKKVLSYILVFILGIGITTFAYSYNASDISYRPSNNNWNVNNVKSAIDDIKNNYYKLDTPITAEASDIVSGKTAYDNLGNLITGSHTENCVVGSFVYSNNLKVVDFNPKVFLSMNENKFSSFFNLNVDSQNAYSGRPTTGVLHIDPFNNIYRIDNGLYVHDWSENWQGTNYYIACK